MARWNRLFRRAAPSNSIEYGVAFCLYSADGKRCSEVRERRDGAVYFVDRVSVEGTTFKDRGRGGEIGPYQSLKAAEAAAVSRPWFHQGEDSD